MFRFLRFGALVLLVVFLLIQLVPYGWVKTNPPITQEAPWPTPEDRLLAVDACYDCHSNETEWPVWSYVAPMSWLIRMDVDRGRDDLNFSTWDDDDGGADDAADTIVEGSMPPFRYIPLHPDARLSQVEQQRLVTALLAIDEARGVDLGDSSGQSRGRGRGRSGG
jgi:hypothetical protein